MSKRQRTIKRKGKVFEEEESALMEQDTLEYFCYFVISHEIAERSMVRKFFKAISHPNIAKLDERLN
ncbi:hypothetical protein D9754_16580 [Planomicrobium sp. Y74]|nr:hypothetical protein D9754_16580 [Planomicrobium sp. Y74]